MGRFIPNKTNLQPVKKKKTREDDLTFQADGFYALQPEPGKIQKGDSITVLVPGGVGDIFWTYQKLAPHFDEIHYQVACTEINKIQQRSKTWLELFPKVKSSKFVVVDGETYYRVVSGYFSLRRLMQRWADGESLIEYGCNHWLEDGTRLDEIDRGYGLDWDVPLLSQEFKLPYKDYLVLYASGSAKARPEVWRPEQWIECVKAFCDKAGKLPVVVIGAKYDQDVTEKLHKELEDHNFYAKMLIDQKPAKVVYLLQQCKFFFGYQSGLNIVADNFDVPQLMLYYPHLSDMQKSWAKKKNLVNGIHNTAIFTEKPTEIAERLPDLT